MTHYRRLVWVFILLTAAVTADAAVRRTKYQRLRADLAALADYHENLQYIPEATVEDILRAVVAKERALVNKEY